MSEWQLIDGQTSESGHGQLIVTHGDNVLDIGALLATVHEDTPAFGQFTQTARLMAGAPELAKLAANLAALALELGAALADWHGGTATTRPYQQTYDRDQALLDRTQRVVGRAKAALGKLADSDET